MLQNTFTKGQLWLCSDWSRTSVSSAFAMPVSLFWPFLNAADSIFLKKEAMRKLITTGESLGILCFQKWLISHTGFHATSSKNAQKKNDPSHKKITILCLQEWKDVLQQISTLKIRLCTNELTEHSPTEDLRSPGFHRGLLFLYMLSFSASCLMDK